RIIAAVIGPQLEVAAGQLHVHLPHPRDLAHPRALERIADRNLPQAGERPVLEPRGDGASRGAQAREPALTDHDALARTRPGHGTIQHITCLVVTQHVLAERARLAAALRFLVRAVLTH